MNIKNEILRQVATAQKEEQRKREASKKKNAEVKIKDFREAMKQVFEIELPESSRMTQLRMNGVTFFPVSHYSQRFFKAKQKCSECGRIVFSHEIYSASGLVLTLDKNGRKWSVRHSCFPQKKKAVAPPPPPITREQKITRLLEELLSLVFNPEGGLR